MKTLKELNAKPGDVVQFFGGEEYTVMPNKSLKHPNGSIEPYFYWDTTGYFTVVSRAEDTPTKWGDMTPEQKGALLLAHHEGKVIEWYYDLACEFSLTNSPVWGDSLAYRIKPEPKIKEVVLHGAGNEWGQACKASSEDTHRITFNTVDGVPDCSSVKMEIT